MKTNDINIVEWLFEYSQTTYFSFTIEIDNKEYEWCLICIYDSNSMRPHYDFGSRVDEDPNLTDEQLDDLMDRLLNT